MMRCESSYAKPMVEKKGNIRDITHTHPSWTCSIVDSASMSADDGSHDSCDDGSTE